MKAKIPKTIEALAVSVDDLKVHPNNARKGNLDQLMLSLKKNGQYRPIVVNTRTKHVLAGNHTLMAARELGWAHVAVTWVNIAADREARILLADNRISDLGSYDDAALLELLKPLAEDLDGTGFDDIDVMQMLSEADQALAKGSGRNDPGAGERPEEPITQLGDRYVLGDHILICGDATDPAVHDALYTDPVAMLWTDPPYGMSVTGGSTDPRDPKYKSGKKLANDELKGEALRALLRKALGACQIVPGGPTYIAAPSNGELLDFLLVLTELKWYRNELVWVKPSNGFGRTDYQGRHETILYGWVPGASHEWRGGRKQGSVFEIDRAPKSLDHPTMKPVDLIVKHVRNSSATGAVVLDPFAGSGSTIIACQETKRVCRAIELDPGYCDVIVARWEEATGGTAVRVAAGEELHA